MPNPTNCAVCGAEFQPRSTVQVTCGPECQYRRFKESDAFNRAQLNRKRKREADAEYRKATDWSCRTEVRRCQWCDHEFTAKARKATRFCCHEHAVVHGMHERGKSQSPWSPRWPDVIRRDSLDQARRAIEYAERDRRIRFAGAACKGCGDVFLWDYKVGGVAAEWCSDICQVRAQRARRRARERNAFVENVPPAQVYKRDRYRCQICNGRLAMKQVVPHPKAPTIDHIIPLAAGGTHEMRNAQAAHFWCNANKSANAANDQLLLFG